jgi:MFS transporter, ACDE family, multidrug resistance protein
VLSTVHSALTAADAEEAQPAPSAGRADAEEAVYEVPGSPAEAILAEEALREDRIITRRTP